VGGRRRLFGLLCLAVRRLTLRGLFRAPAHPCHSCRVFVMCVHRSVLPMDREAEAANCCPGMSTTGRLGEPVLIFDSKTEASGESREK
jgi:hypothetical protein